MPDDFDALADAVLDGGIPLSAATDRELEEIIERSQREIARIESEESDD